MDLNSLSLSQGVGQLFFIGIPAPELDGPTRELIEDVRPGGVCLFARNIRSREQTRKLLDDLRDYLPITPLLAVDQEGGLVDRLRRIMTPMPAAGTLRDPADAGDLGRIIGETLSVLGFNMDFAPVVDVVDKARAAFSNGLFTRPFGQRKEETTGLAGSFLNALQDQGVLGCLKHFPGLGAATVDSHEELPVVEIDDKVLQDVDLFPYRQLLPHTHAVMIAHAAYPNTRLQDSDQSGKLLPSSLSRAFVTTLLREQMGFNGLAITDDLEMGAIIKNYGIGEACKMAVNAGADMLAICADPGRIREGYAAVLAAVQNGDIGEERLLLSLKRIATVKRAVRSPVPFDNDRLDQLSNDTTELAARLN